MDGNFKCHNISLLFFFTFCIYPQGLANLTNVLVQTELQHKDLTILHRHQKNCALQMEHINANPATADIMNPVTDATRILVHAQTAMGRQEPVAHITELRNVQAVTVIIICPVVVVTIALN